MRLLLDSHALLWALHAPELLSSVAAQQIRDARNVVYFSAASAWELELKAAKGKLRLPDNWLDVAVETGFMHLPIGADICRLSARLPWHHADPFDRLLVAQAMHDELTLATRDAWLSKYDVTVLPA